MHELYDYVEFNENDEIVKGVIRDFRYDAKKNVQVIIEDKNKNLHTVNMLDIRPARL